MTPQIEIVPKSTLTKAEADILTKWQNDPEIAHLIRPNFHEQPLQRVNIEEVRRVFETSSYGRRWYFGYLDGRLVGECSFQIDPPYVHRPIPDTAWPGVCVGDTSGRSRGVGKLLMDRLERGAKAAGAKRVELGVFEFNLVARRFYSRLGYEKIEELSSFTFWAGQWWSDIRMEKWL